MRLCMCVRGYECVQYMSELRASFGDAVDMWDHYDALNKSHVDISNFGEYFITTIESLLISQRKVHVRVRTRRLLIHGSDL